MNCVETVHQILHRLGVTECDVERRVVCILNMVDSKRANHTSDYDMYSANINGPSQTNRMIPNLSLAEIVAEN
jgi:hypothetical protein